MRCRQKVPAVTEGDRIGGNSFSRGGCSLMALSRQESFAAASVSPVILDVYYEAAKWFLIIFVELDKHNQFYSQSWGKKEKKLKVVGVDIYP